MKDIIVIVGPTGVGKTKLSIELAKKLDAEIINGDSVAIYKRLDIGSAKPTLEEMDGIFHHLIDIRDVTSEYSVFDYQKDVRRLIEDISSRGNRIIIVGGTGLYIKAALYDYEFDAKATNTYDGISNDELYKKLLEVDPETDIHLNNRVRIISALNYYEANHKPYSEKEKSSKLLYDALFIGLTTERDILYYKINQRVDKMLMAGLENEARLLYDSGVR